MADLCMQAPVSALSLGSESAAASMELDAAVQSSARQPAAPQVLAPPHPGVQLHRSSPAVPHFGLAPQQAVTQHPLLAQGAFAPPRPAPQRLGLAPQQPALRCAALHAGAHASPAAACASLHAPEELAEAEDMEVGGAGAGAGSAPPPACAPAPAGAALHARTL